MSEFCTLDLEAFETFCKKKREEDEVKRKKAEEAKKIFIEETLCYLKNSLQAIKNREETIKDEQNEIRKRKKERIRIASYCYCLSCLEKDIYTECYGKLKCPSCEISGSLE